MNRRDDYRHIFACVVGIRRNWDRFVEPMAPEVNDCTDVSMEPKEYPNGLVEPRSFREKPPGRHGGAGTWQDDQAARR